jgi:hypothetical protein
MTARKSREFSNGFSFVEMTANANGKTSGSGTAGLLIVLIGALGFITGTILIVLGKDQQELLIQSIAIIYAGATLLGVRKAKGHEYEPRYERDPDQRTEEPI